MPNLKKNTSIYLFSNIINAAIPFLLIPILTRYLSVDDYGKLALFQALLLALGSIIGLNSVSAVARKYFDENISTLELSKYRTNSIYILVTSSVVVCFISFFSMNYITSSLSISSSWVYIGIAISSFSFFISLILTHFQVRYKAKEYGFIQIGRSLLNMFLTLFFVVFLIEGGEGRVEAMLISSVVFFMISIYILLNNDLLHFYKVDISSVKELLKYGIPLIPHTVGLFLITSADRFFINDKLGLKEAGIYMVAVQLSSVMTVIFDSINKAYTPWLFDKLKENNREMKIKIVRYTYIYMLIVLCVSLLSFLIGPFIIDIIAGEKYREAGSIIGWLCLGQGFSGMYLIITNYIFYTKKTAKLSMITIITGFTNVVLLLLFIEHFGLIGAALAFSCSKFIQFIMTWVLSMNVINMPWFHYD